MLILPNAFCKTPGLNGSSDRQFAGSRRTICTYFSYIISLAGRRVNGTVNVHYGDFVTYYYTLKPKLHCHDGQSKAGGQIFSFYFPKPVLWAETLRSFAPCLTHHEVVKLRMLNHEGSTGSWGTAWKPPPLVLNCEPSTCVAFIVNCVWGAN